MEPRPNTSYASELSVLLASDNTAPAHSEVLVALEQEAASGHEGSYGADHASAELQGLIEDEFGPFARALSMFNGTGANSVSLLGTVPQGAGTVGTSVAHYYRNSGGAWATGSGHPYLPIGHSDGKMCVGELEELLERPRGTHEFPLGAVSITQPTEYGVCYEPDEVGRIANTAHRSGLLVHMDGARLFTAAAALDRTLKELTFDVGVDVLVLGGTKAGAAFGELVVLNGNHAEPAVALARKRSGQLPSKARYVAAQFVRLLGSNLGIEGARRSLCSARALADIVSEHPELRLSRPVQTNAVFARVEPVYVPRLQELGLYHCWDQDSREVRWMTSYATLAAHINALRANLRSNSVVAPRTRQE